MLAGSNLITLALIATSGVPIDIDAVQSSLVNDEGVIGTKNFVSSAGTHTLELSQADAFGEGFASFQLNFVQSSGSLVRSERRGRIEVVSRQRTLDVDVMTNTCTVADVDTVLSTETITIPSGTGNAQVNMVAGRPTTNTPQYRAARTSQHITITAPSSTSFRLVSRELIFKIVMTTGGSVEDYATGVYDTDANPVGQAA